MSDIRYFCMVDRRILIILTFLLVQSLFAQEPVVEMFRLGAEDLNQSPDTSRTEIISASRNIKYLEDLPVTVYVISREEILENGYISLVDALKDVPGIKVSQPGSGIEGETFLMNGLFGNYYCKILVNGIPITPSVASGTSITGNLPIRQAERIEIITGLSSALYGSDALAGVINIITKESDRPAWTQADISVGSQGNYNMNVMIGGKMGKNKNVAEYSFYGNYSQKNDMNVKYDIPGNYDPNLYDTTATSKPNYRGTETEPQFDRLPQNSSMLGFGIKYRGIKANYDYMNRKTHSSIGQSTGQYAYYDPNSFWGESINRFALSYENAWGKISSTTQISLLNYRLDNNSSFRLLSDDGDNGRVYKYAASDDIFFDEILNYSVNKNLELTGGFSFQISGNLPKTNDLSEPFDKELYKPFSTEKSFQDPVFGSFGYNPINFNNIAGFFQLYYNYQKLTLIGGIRWDEHSLFGSNFSPKLGLQYKLTKKLSLRANYGQGFRAPSLYYVYNSLAYTMLGESGDTLIRYENIPNPDIKPERFRSFEFGIRHKASDNISVEFIFFYHKLNENITNSLIFVDSLKYPNNSNPFALGAVNDNSSKAELYRGQLNIRANDLVSLLKLNCDLYITYSKGKEVLPNNFGTLHDYRNMPNWMIQVNLDFQPARKWVVILHNTISDSWKKRLMPFTVEEMKERGFQTDVSGFYTLDLINRFKINKNFHAFLIIENIFNSEYGGIDAYGGLYDLSYNPQYKRNFKLGFSFRME